MWRFAQLIVYKRIYEERKLNGSRVAQTRDVENYSRDTNEENEIENFPLLSHSGNLLFTTFN